MKKKLLILISLMILTSCQNNSEFKKIKVAGIDLKVQIVTTNAEMAKGLGGRDSLASDEGMLFIYPGYRRPGFWMKDMNFPIDIIWIKDGIIVDITENVPVVTATPLGHYWPKEPINYVLEVNAGFSKINSIQIGDQVSLP